jgi:ABC-type dipeptide/oligopeptide/nickel transport system permease component
MFKYIMKRIGFMLLTFCVIMLVTVLLVKSVPPRINISW